MKKILALDTATRAASAAVAADGALMAEFALDVGLTHSQTFLPMLASLLEAAGLSLHEMDALAVTVGPGSFTGLRIGVASAKALAEAEGLAIVPVTTLDALAELARPLGGFCAPILDARRGEVYTALYRDGERQSEYRALSLDAWLEELGALSAPVAFCGDGVRACRDKLSAWSAARLLPEDYSIRLAAGAASLAFQRQALPPEELQPFYLRRSEAERKREERERAAEAAKQDE